MKLAKISIIALLAAACVTPAFSGERPSYIRKQLSELNLSVIVLKDPEIGSNIRIDQTGKNNTSITLQGMNITGPFQFGPEDIPLNKVNVTQHGADNASLSGQRGINNDAVVIQLGELVSGKQTHDHTYSVEDFEDGGFRMLYQTGEVDIDILYEMGGTRASSSFGRSH